MSGYSNAQFEEFKPVPRQKAVAKPVEVTFSEILSIEKHGEGGVWVLDALHLADGTRFVPTPEQLARIDPKPGDYVVWQEDGYCYLNPKQVFERKYKSIDD